MINISNVLMQSSTVALLIYQKKSRYTFETIGSSKLLYTV